MYSMLGLVLFRIFDMEWQSLSAPIAVIGSVKHYIVRHESYGLVVMVAIICEYLMYFEAA